MIFARLIEELINLEPYKDLEVLYLGDCSLSRANPKWRHNELLKALIKLFDYTQKTYVFSKIDQSRHCDRWVIGSVFVGAVDHRLSIEQSTSLLNRNKQDLISLLKTIKTVGDLDRKIIEMQLKGIL